MNPYEHLQPDAARNKRSDRYNAPEQSEPSMSAPQPLPGKSASAYAAPQQWSAQTTPVNQAPAGNQPVQQPYGWQQGYTPVPQTAGQGWQQPRQPAYNGWQQPAAQTAPVRQPATGSQYADWSRNGNGYAPAAYEQQPGQAGNGGGKPPVNLRGILILAVVAIVVIVGVVLAVNGVNNVNQANALREYVTAYADRFCQGVYVDGIHLGGMTKEQALQAVQAQAQQRCDQWNVRLETPSDNPDAEPGEMDFVGEITAAMLGMTVDVNDALNAAWAQGHTGTTVQSRKAEMDALLENPYHGTTAQPSGNTSAIDAFLNSLAQAIYIAPTDAYLVDFIPTNTNPFVIQAESYGRMLEVETLKEQIYQLVETMESGTIVFEPQPIAPSVTKAQLTAEKLTLRGSWYTKISTTSTENRNMNIDRACDLITGTEIQPGKNFSFNDVVGPRTEKAGFYKATVYEYGKETEGFGGGVCQVSSTLYVAAVRANLEIVKRTQHALIVGYTELGLDATVNYDGKKIDFVFKNNTASPIYIVAKVMKDPHIDKVRDIVLVNIYGEPLESGVTYDLVATQTEVPVPAEVEMIADVDAQYVLYTDETHTIKGKVGYEVDSFKVKYVDGKEVERTHMYHDSYAPVKTVVYTGVSERPLALE